MLPPNMTVSLIPLSPGDCKTVLDRPACTSPNFLTDPLLPQPFQLQLGD